MGAPSQPNGRGPAGIDEVNMTPLIDVSLVLVVILMVAMPMVFQSSIAVRGATAAGREAEVPARTERVEIAIVSEDSVRVNKTLVGRDQLDMTLAPLLHASATGMVVVQCGDGISHGTFVNVLDHAKASGATEIAVLSR
jgi:biopolymer transport protein ExbD